MPRTSSRTREAPCPIEQAGVALEQITEEAPDQQDRHDPQRAANGVKKQERAISHPILPGNRRGQRGQRGHKLGEHQHYAAAAAE